MASIFRSIRAVSLLLFGWCASIGMAVGYAIGDLVERTFLDDFPSPHLDASASLEADQIARQVDTVEDEAKASRFKSYMDVARQHDMYSCDGFAYG